MHTLIKTEKIPDKLIINGYSTPQENIKPGNQLCNEDLEGINTVFTILKSAENYSLSNLITSINIQNSDNYILYLESEKKTVELGNLNNIEIKMLYLQSIIEKEKGAEETLFLDVDFKSKFPYGRFN